MSVYYMNKILYLTENDATFRERIHTEPESTVAGFPLTDEERNAFTSGDISTLFKMGVHPFLLNNFARHGLFGINDKNYFPRIRDEETSL